VGGVGGVGGEQRSGAGAVTSGPDVADLGASASVGDVLDRLEYCVAAGIPFDERLLRRAEREARAAGRTALTSRAELLLADRLAVRGHVAEAVRDVRRLRDQAVPQRDELLLSGVHRVLARLLRGIGDKAGALSHSIEALALLPPDAVWWRRVALLNGLGMALDMNGSWDEAQDRYAEALRLADDAADPQLALAVVNNHAYAWYERGEVEATCALVEQMVALSRREGVHVPAHSLDTMARGEMLRGRYAEAERLLEPLSGEPGRELHTEADSLAGCLVTLAAARRALGRLDAAAQTLDRCQQLAAAGGLDAVRVAVHDERAALYAAQGRHAEAYAELRTFHAAWIRLQDSDREVRAHVVRALYADEETRRDRDEFRELATRDPLTGLHNRRFSDEELTRLADAADDRRPLSVALLDLDHFKRVNDEHSHEVGDLVLQRLATVIMATAPDDALVARLGGEEFLLGLPGAGSVEAEILCERLRLAVRETDWSGTAPGLRITVSIGLTTTAGGTTASALLAAADRELYAAKRSGRDRVCVDRSGGDGA